MEYYKNILETIGNTPLVRLGKTADKYQASIFVKLESFNPGYSIKDRIAVRMIEDFERSGQLRAGGTIVECTSGNTGVAVAMAGIVKGYQVILAIPDKTSAEKIAHIKALGAKVVVTASNVPPESPDSYYSTARRIADSTPGAVLLNQYHNMSNFESHYHSTGPEVWRQMDGKVDYFVACMSTGGTLSGAGKYLKEQNPDVRVVGVDIEGSGLAAEYYGTSSELKPYKVEGVGKEHKPDALLFEYVDEVITVGDKDAFNTARRVAATEGILMGGSSGVAVRAALRLAERVNTNANIVVIAPDSGIKYLSKMYSDAWMWDNRFMDEAKLTVAELLSRKRRIPQLIYAEPSITFKDAVDTMLKSNISQMPVLRDGEPIGSLEEHKMMVKVYQEPALLSQPVTEVMSASFPSVTSTTPVEEVRRLFTAENTSALLVEQDSIITGIITKSDLLEVLK